MADKTQATWRAFTIQGPQVALAMLRGSKRIESRKRRMAAGWYYLHVGRQSINSLPPECSAALRQTWPDAPEEASLSKSCVVGMVCLGKVIQASKVEKPMGLCLLAVGPRDCCHRRVQIPSSMGKGEASCLACQRWRDVRKAEGSNRLGRKKKLGFLVANCRR